ncbi:MAG: hypothetical protein L0Y68_02185 [Candidatus Dadabacteria bacterium]|nr:hypothetical protein [Candidatus Dadabacteria bacterium]
MEVTVNNGFFHRNCIITFSTEASLNPPDIPFSLNIGYAFDSDDPSDCQFLGPNFLLFGEPGEHARTIVGVKKLGPGFHTIRPCFIVNDANTTGLIAFPCLIVECRTQ